MKTIYFTNYLKRLLYLMFTGLSFTILNAQYFNGVAITAVDSGNGTNNILFSATSSTIPLLAKIRAQVISGSGKFTWNGDNFRFTSSVFASASGIPNNKSQIQITFLQSNGTTLIPASDLRFIISDLDGPDNEAIAVGCSSGLKFFGTSPNSNITLTNDSEIRGTGTANQNYEPSSTVILEFSKQNTIIIDTYGNKNFYKEFDLNNNDYALSTTLYTQCNSLDNDGDGITNKNDLDDDNDGILDTAESGIYNPEGDADGDGLPNYLDIVNNAGQSSFFSPDGSSTSYTDANNNGIPDVYDLDGDGLPNHLDTDSDGDGCPDAVEGGDNISQSMLDANGRINVAANGTTTPVVVDANGVPVVTNTGSIYNVDGQAQGQTIGQSQINNPVAVAGTVGSNQTIVSGASPSALSLTGSTGTIQWQSSTDNVTFANISGATSSSYFPGTMTSTTYYRAVVSSLGGCSVNTNSVVITVVPNTDSDGDGITDNLDLDDDNDGILDSLECPGTASFTNGGLEGSAAIATDPTGWNRVTYDEAYNEATVSGQDTVDIITSTGPASGIGLSGVPAEGNSAIHAVYGPSISGGFAQEGIKQTISGLTVGKYYRVTFKQAVVKSFNYVDNTGKWNVFLDGNFIYSSLPTTSTLAYTDPNISWESRSFIFTATATSHTIAFLASGMTTANKVAMGLDDIKFDTSCDLDNDGIPNTLDLDSDDDGCADALEGSENVKYNQIHDLNLPLADPNYAYRGQIKVTYNGTTTSTPSGIVSNSISANGVPQLLNNAGNNLNASTNPSNLAGTVDNTDGTADIGQGIGEAYNAAIQSGCFCYKPAQTTGNALDTNHGITALGRAGADNSNWPMVRKGAWTVLEAKTKGFVVNRLTDAQITDIPSADLREGMMVYNITQDCLQINIDGTATGWKCFNTQTCPD